MDQILTIKEKVILRRGNISKEIRAENETTDKGLTSKIYKQLIQLNAEKQTTQSKSGKKT